MSPPRGRGAPWLVLMSLAIAGGVAADEMLEFGRVRVPAGRLGDLPLGGDRYVPMPVADFERAVARRGAVAAPRPMLDAISYEAACNGDGRLAGTLAFELVAERAPAMPEVVLGRLDAFRATLRTAAGVGEVGLFGIPSGGVAIRTPAAGRYECGFVLPPFDHRGTVRIPLAAALTATVRLTLPAGVRPVVACDPGRSTALVRREGDAWLVTAAGVDAVIVTLVRDEPRPPRLRVWNHVRITGRRAEVVARVVPEDAWIERTLDLVPAAGLTVTTDADRGPSVAGTAAGLVRLELPAQLLGTRLPVDVSGVAPFEVDRAQSVPVVRAPDATWAGGGTTLVVDPPLALGSIDLEHAATLEPADAAAWPAAAGLADAAGTAGRERAALVHVEDQAAESRVVVRVTPRPADFDVARVTTVEISPGTVVGRAACDVRIAAGEAFGVSARIAPGWFIDAVEAVDWEADPGPDVAAGAESGRALPVIDTTRAIDWRVVRNPEVAELRIDLAEAATRSRSLGLRIKGHRRGVPLGSTFVTADMDMVRLDGEAPGNALLDFRVGPEAVVEIDGSPIGILAAEGRFAPLVEPGSARARIPGGVRAPSREARLVQRRPPLDAGVQVQLVARDGQIAESTTVTCRPDAGAIDSVVVHFSEPLGDAATWTLLTPEGTTAVPRRLETADASPRSRLPRGIAESWLVELRPAVEAAVTLRASRTRPFAASLPVSLAWVEGATEDRGTVVVRGAAGGRPTVINRQLWELPPEAAESGDAAGVVAEFRYAGPESLAAAGGPPAEVVPVPAAEARAWAWRERTTAWFHEAGRTEFESTYDLENRGRGELTFTVPSGTTLREIAVDGTVVSFDAARASAGSVGIELPAERVRCELIVRGEVAAVGGSGVRRVTLEPCTIDAPILDRRLLLMVPPALDVIGHRATDAPRAGVLARLFAAAPVGERAAAGASGGAIGFRRLEIASSAHGSHAVLVVRRDLLASIAMLVWICAAALTAWAAPRYWAAVTLACCGAALVALWIDESLVVVARAAWWGILAGGVLGRSHVPPATALLVAALLAGGSTRASAAEPWRVYFPGDDPGMAFVPERLHRLLAEDAAAAAAAVRVRSCSLRPPARSDGEWTLALEIEADRGGVLAVRQCDGCRWEPPREAAGGAVVDITADGREARIVATVAGIRTLTLGVVPSAAARGMVESFDVALPPAARAEVVVAEPVAAGGWQCDRDDPGGSWSPVRGRDDRFDVSHATAVRLHRPRDPRHPLAVGVRDATSVNEVSWSRSACRLRATFEVGPTSSMVRSVVIRTSPGLRAVPAPGSVEARPLAADRWVADVADPAPGRTVIECGFELPLVEPVGLFDVPHAWIEGAESDVRTVRCLADPALDVVPELPVGMTLVRPRDPEPTLAAAWRTETISGPRNPDAETPCRSTAAVEAAGAARVARVAIRRRPGSIDVAQRLDVAYAAEHVALTLEAEIDALAVPLTTIPIEVPRDAVVDAFALRRLDGEEEQAVDAFAARPEADQLAVVVQRPRSGRFHLQLQARVPGPPARAASMPVARWRHPGAAPLTVTWRSTPDLVVDVAGGADLPVPEVRDVAWGDPGPVATVGMRESGEPVGSFGEAGTAATGPGDPLGVDLGTVMVHVALDGRGRAWGLARFDLAPATRDVTLRMPTGMRVYDILVDGREARATPLAGNLWSVSLHDIRWPRTALVVFAGDVPGRPDRGDVILLEPPRIEGADSREVLWSIDSPDGMPLRLVGESQPLDMIAWGGRRDAARQRMAAAFDRALENVAGPESDRLTAFAQRRDQGEPPALESALDRAFVASAADRRLFALGVGDRGIKLRAARQGDPTTAARAAASLAAIGALAFAWAVAGAGWIRAVRRRGSLHAPAADASTRTLLR